MSTTLAQIASGVNPPSSPEDKTLWFNEEDLQLYIYNSDVEGWIQLTGSSCGGSGGGTQPTLSSTGGLAYNEDGELTLVTEESSFQYIVYLNREGNNNAPKTYSTMGTGGGAFKVVNERFTNMSGVIGWMSNNLTSGRGKVVCLYETDTVEVHWRPQNWFPSMSVYGDASVGLHDQGLGPEPNSSVGRKTARFTKSDSLNYIDLWSNAPKLTIVGLNMQFTAGSASYCFIRALGGMIELIGCKIIQTGANYTGRIIEAVDSGTIRIRPLRGYWRGGSLSAADPFFEGKNLAALEMKDIKAAHAILAQQGSAIKIVEYSYAGYGVTTFTESARIQYMGSYHITDANIGLRSVSSYESNGPAISEDPLATRQAQANYEAFDAAAFCSVTFNKYNNGSESLVPQLEGVKPDGENIDYRLNVEPTFDTNFKTYQTLGK